MLGHARPFWASLGHACHAWAGWAMLGNAGPCWTILCHAGPCYDMLYMLGQAWPCLPCQGRLSQAMLGHARAMLRPCLGHGRDMLGHARPCQAMLGHARPGLALLAMLGQAKPSKRFQAWHRKARPCQTILGQPVLKKSLAFSYSRCFRALPFSNFEDIVVLSKESNGAKIV